MVKVIRFKSRGANVFCFAHLADLPEPAPAIILCHGFTGNSIESGRLFVEFANVANAQGYHVFRFDFVGSGNSIADFADNTRLGGWVKDIQNAISCAARQKMTDKTRMYLVGLSFGGAAALIAGKSKRITAVAGWAPVIHLEETFKGIFGMINWQQLIDGKDIADCYSGTSYHVKPHFLEDLSKYSIRKAIDQYGGKPALIVQGTADPVINAVHANSLAQRYPSVSVEMMNGADHVFNLKRETLYKITLDFFKNSQKRGAKCI